MSAPPTRDDEQGSRRRAVLGLVVAAGSAAALTVAVTAGDPSLRWLDQPISAATRSWVDAWGWPVDLTSVVGTLTQPALAGLLVAGLVLWLLRAGLRPAAAMLAISGIGGALLTTGVKNLVSRERPASAEGLVRDMDASFPSGHTSAGIYLFMAAGLVLLHLGRADESVWLRRLGLALVVVGPLIGVTRLVLGAHWPSDILGGWAYGATALLTAALVVWTPMDRGWCSRRSPALPR